MHRRAPIVGLKERPGKPFGKKKKEAYRVLPSFFLLLLLLLFPPVTSSPADAEEKKTGFFFGFVGCVCGFFFSLAVLKVGESSAKRLIALRRDLID